MEAFAFHTNYGWSFVIGMILAANLHVVWIKNIINMLNFRNYTLRPSKAVVGRFCQSWANFSPKQR